MKEEAASPLIDAEDGTSSEESAIFALQVKEEGNVGAGGETEEIEEVREVEEGRDGNLQYLSVCPTPQHRRHRIGSLKRSSCGRVYGRGRGTGSTAATGRKEVGVKAEGASARNEFIFVQI